MKLATKVFLILLGITLAVWILRGIGLLAFLPGIILWVLLLLSIGVGVFSRFQRIQT